jgi:hypothetical protein
MAKEANKVNRGKNTTILVLGAGATRACSFVRPEKWPCLPPLNKDFFTQLQRVPDKKHQNDINAIIKDVIELFGANFAVTLEDVFSTLEHTIRMLSVTQKQRAYKKSHLQAIRDRLMAAIAIVMEASLAEHGDDGHAKQSALPCKYHEKIVNKILRRKDHIISFNYDCVIDYALRARGDGKWDPHYGYGFNLGPRGTNIEGDDAWRPEKPAGQNTTIHLHKLHGSLHFQFGEGDSKKVRLKERPYTKQHGTPRYSIIPPESNKAYDKGIFAVLWANAAEALGRARNLIIIGYSLPATDLHATALFRTSIRSEQLKSLTIVNPSREDRARIRSVVQRGISTETRVLSFDSVREFLATNPSVWRG